MRTFALLPAAGKSTRMGRPKLALPLGDRTVLERVVTTLRLAGVDDILVVLGPHVADLKDLAAHSGARVLLLEQETPDMRATIERGLDWLEEHESPQPADALLLLPPDHPTLSAEVVQGLLAAVAASTASIGVPTHKGRRGHPALIRWSHVPGMRALPAGQGLNSYLRAHAAETMEVPFATPDVLCDLDTPADYERLQRLFSQ